MDCKITSFNDNEIKCETKQKQSETKLLNAGGRGSIIELITNSSVQFNDTTSPG